MGDGGECSLHGGDSILLWHIFLYTGGKYAISVLSLAHRCSLAKQVVGLLAYMIATDQYDLSQSAADNLIDRFSWSRAGRQGPPTIVWNREDGSHVSMPSNSTLTTF